MRLFHVHNNHLRLYIGLGAGLANAYVLAGLKGEIRESDAGRVDAKSRKLMEPE
jgi:hypothetical protein